MLAVLAAIGLVALATAAGLLIRRSQGRVRIGSHDRIAPADVALERGQFGERVTLLQFSTEFCSRCPGVRRMLTAVADGLEGVSHADVDLTHRTDIASRYGVLQTPTTFVLDRHGRIAARIGGVPDRRAVGTLVEELALNGSTASGHPATGPGASIRQKDHA